MPAMCAGSGGGGRATSGYPEAFQSSPPTLREFDEEVKVLQQQNARLRQQQLSLERQLSEQGRSLRQQHEEELSHRVARHTREMASLVSQHEEELRRVVHRYEQQLSGTVQSPAATWPGRSHLPASGSHSPPAAASPSGSDTEDRQRRSFQLPGSGKLLLQQQQQPRSERERPELAAAGDAEVARYKRKVQKLKAKREEELRVLRSRIGRVMATAACREETGALRRVLLAWRSQTLQAASMVALENAAAAAALAQIQAQAVTAAKPVPTVTAAGLMAAEEGWAAEATVHARLISAAAVRAPLTCVAVLHAWSSVVMQRRHEAELQAQQQKAAMRSNSAVSSLRNEARASRCRGHRAACRSVDLGVRLVLALPLAAWGRLTLEARALRMSQALLASQQPVATPRPGFAERTPLAAEAAASLKRAGARLAWAADQAALLRALRAWWASRAEARHAILLRDKVDEASVQSTLALRSLRDEVRAVRQRCRHSALLATSRRALLSNALAFAAWARQVGRNDPRQASKQTLEELTKEHRQQVSHLQLEVSDARQSAAASARREARAENIARRHELAANRGEELAAMLACFKAWLGEAVLSRSNTRLRQEAERSQTEAVARARLESRGALHKAWSEASEASRRAAALQRRLEEASDEQSFGNSLEVTRLDGYDRSRPTTALAIEQRLLQSEERVRTRLATAAGASGSSRGVSRGGLGTAALRQVDKPKLIGEAEVLNIEEAEASTEESAVQTEGPSVDEEVIAAREGRKGLFIAALAQQAKYWQAQAWHTWRRAVLQSRCERLEAQQLPSTPKRASGGSMARATTPRSAGQQQRLTPGSSTPRSGGRR